MSPNDLTKLVPGLTSVDEGSGDRGRTNNLTLRGLRTDSPGGGELGAETPGSSVNAVSTYFGETPVFFPMPLYDIDHVEVLRGPQGTLYGSGAQAGTIRVVPNRPDFKSDSAEIQLDVNKSEHSNDPGRNVIGIGNLAIADTLAIRARYLYHGSQRRRHQTVLVIIENRVVNTDRSRPYHLDCRGFTVTFGVLSKRRIAVANTDVWQLGLPIALQARCEGAYH